MFEFWHNFSMGFINSIVDYSNLFMDWVVTPLEIGSFGTFAPYELLFGSTLLLILGYGIFKFIISIIP